MSENAEQIHDRLKKRLIQIKNESSASLRFKVDALMSNIALPAGTNQEQADFFNNIVERILMINSHFVNHEIDSLITLMAETEAQRLSNRGE